MKRRADVIRYFVFDVIAAVLAWVLFFFYRKIFTDNITENLFHIVLHDKNLYLGILAITALWIILYIIVGTYQDIYRKSRLKELGLTLLTSLIGVIIVFFILILSDTVTSHIDYYRSFLVLFLLHFFFTFLFRFVLSTRIVRLIQKRVIVFNTVIIGSNGSAVTIYNEIENQTHSSGNKFLGFIYVKDYDVHPMSEHLPNLGSLSDIRNIVSEHHVEEVIIAVDRAEHGFIANIITILEELGVVIKIIPDLQDILIGSVKMSAIWHAPLIRISPERMSPWHKSIKRFIDISVSIIAMIILAPAYLFVAIGVKMGSRGPVFYSHERIGIHGKPFLMYKFRSMYMDAEKDGPQLSSKDDSRITSFGRFLRKVRLDETPQFYHVLKGDMSLVGPRPERQYYIDQIVERAPHYRMLHKVKPGITSWGQVKYGYAENVEEMLERLKYDILYIENMSIAMDIKILIYTMLIIMQGRGK